MCKLDGIDLFLVFFGGNGIDSNFGFFFLTGTKLIQTVFQFVRQRISSNWIIQIERNSIILLIKKHNVIHNRCYMKR